MEAPVPELSPSLAGKIASYSPAPPTDIPIELHQAVHRINLVNAWRSIPPGSRVLELGCGQGTCTAVLAEAVGPTGHVDGVDPGSPTYGSPFTLAQAQAHISASPVGDRIAWHTGVDPLDFLEQAAKRDETWDVAILVHCIWYFRSVDTLVRLLEALRGRVRRVCVAEWALVATEPAAVPHVLAALARATLEAHRGTSSENIQTLLSPAGIKEAAAAAGWLVATDCVLVPGEELRDGVWEVGTVVSNGFVKEIEAAAAVDAKVQVLLKSGREATMGAAQAIGGAKKARAMDVWTAVLENS